MCRRKPYFSFTQPDSCCSYGHFLRFFNVALKALCYRYAQHYYWLGFKPFCMVPKIHFQRGQTSDFFCNSQVGAVCSCYFNSPHRFALLISHIMFYIKRFSGYGGGVFHPQIYGSVLSYDEIQSIKYKKLHRFSV